MTDWYAPSNAYWLRKRDLDMNVTGPVFDFKGKEYTVHIEQGVPHLAARHQQPRRRRPSDAGLPDAAHLQRGSAVCRAQASGARSRRGRTPNGTRWILMPFWGPKHSKFTAPIEYGQVVQGAVAAFKLEDEGGQAAALTGLALAQHVAGRSGRHRQRRGLRVRERRGRDAGDRRHRPGVQHVAEPHRALGARDALRARRADRRRVVVERRSDHVVQPLQQPRGRQRPCLLGTLRRDDVYCFGVEPTAGTK